MWIFTKYGFFSVVVGRRANGRLVIRARSRLHLENLRNRFPKILGSVDTQTSTGTDYPFRVFVTPTEWATMSQSMALEIDCLNFKDEAEYLEAREILDNHYVNALHSVWNVMMQEYRSDK